ncbi:thioredoxin domain-containing protein [Wenyingzhuangia sp. IMCC45574]
MKNFIRCFLLTFIFFGCNSKNDPKHKHTNQLIHETSPYLLQHAHNPVNWHAWNKETLEKAKRENKLILISVGYAACHWCHVMEHESFENDSIAKIMNENFINIKVDREERPDIDQIYMTAVQLMTGNGGWPLNCIALPNGKPFWGGTYFPKEQWAKILAQVSEMYQNEPEKIKEFADNLTQGIQQSELVTINNSAIDFSKEELALLTEKWKQDFDLELGGYNRTPKFPMPNNYSFLMRYAEQANDGDLKAHVYNTLDQIALGGLYDHVGGGFARYSTDAKWHIPHFEKMLYDNAQLISLYADAYLIHKSDLYKEVVYKTFDFVQRELMSTDGAFYSSLDADVRKESGESEEGAYYVWTQQELLSLLKEEFNLFTKVFPIDESSLWEDEKYHLIKSKTNTELAKELNISKAVLKEKIAGWQKTLLINREKREKPALDDKVLTSWNGLMLKGLVNAYRVFDDEAFLNAAIKNASFIKSKQLQSNGALFHNYKSGKSSINGYLEDYASVIDAFMSLYEVTLDRSWLEEAKSLATYSWEHFYNEEQKMFYFTSDEDPALITRKMELADNVISSSNSMMARNLAKLGLYFEHKEFLQASKQMLNNIKNDAVQYPSGYSNWLQLYADNATSFYEVAIVGENAKQFIKELNKNYLPNKLIVASVTESNAPLLEDRYVAGQTYIYVCQEGSCKLPVTTVKEAIKLMK